MIGHAGTGLNNGDIANWRGPVKLIRQYCEDTQHAHIGRYNVTIVHALHHPRHE
jgi:hypothetical protein